MGGENSGLRALLYSLAMDGLISSLLDLLAVDTLNSGMPNVVTSWLAISNSGAHSRLAANNSLAACSHMTSTKTLPPA